MLPFWAIGAFAGLRQAEIERLAWSEVDFAGEDAVYLVSLTWKFRHWLTH